MREEIVTPATARRLAAAGLAWEPQLGDWCILFGGEHLGEGQSGLWLVAALLPATGMLGLVDAQGRWPASQAPARDCLWLPNAGKRKTWLRSRGYRVATGEVAAPPVLGLAITSSAIRHVCRLTRVDAPTDAPLDAEGASEPEALADAILHILGSEGADTRW